MSTMNIAIFGAGFLGHRFAKDIPGATLLPTDITSLTDVRLALRNGPGSLYDAVINAAGKTGRPNVDWCETHQGATYGSNVLGALNVATAAAEAGAYLLHLGSGCIFYGPSPTEKALKEYEETMDAAVRRDGLPPGPSLTLSERGWKEDDFANPTSFYSRTKYAADLVLSRLPNVGIARLRMPIDTAPGTRNLITKLAAYRKIIDVENSVTFVPDLVHVVQELIAIRAQGIFHVTNPGTLRHRDLLALYKEHVDPAHEYTLIQEPDLVDTGLAVSARSSCILSTDRLEKLGIHMRPVEEAMLDTMKKYAEETRRLAR